MKKIMITSFLIFFITGIGLFAQNTGTDDLRNVVKRKNNISWTLGGMGLFSSINYSRVLLPLNPVILLI